MAIGNLYYPKYSKQGTEATISWDVAGYYIYLPSILLYHEHQEMKEMERLRQKYGYSPNPDQYYQTAGGRTVYKYSMGMAVLYLPAFAVAHLVATVLGYEADGYSLPYQFMLFVQGWLVLMIGFYYLRKLLLIFFKDGIVALGLVSIGLATHAIEYGAITNAMSHVYLFAGYAYLFYATIVHISAPKPSYFIKVAVIIGLMALSRPTEIMVVAFVMLLFWFYWGKGFGAFLWKYKWHVMTSALIIGAIGSLQLLYWYLSSGNWIEYSYQDQGFNWLRPHIIDGIFSWRAGWLIYTPLMVLSLIGFFIKGKSKQKWPIVIYTLLFVYVAFAWDIWWYGGSLGQRTMIQIYPLLAFTMCHLYESTHRKWTRYIVYGFVIFCGWYNAWMVHQAHLGGLFKVDEMNKGYLTAVSFRNEVAPETIKLLDAKHHYSGVLIDVDTLDIQKDTLCLDSKTQSTPTTYLDLDGQKKYIRAYIDYNVTEIEHEKWRWTQLVIIYKKGEKKLREHMIRLQRIDNTLGSKTNYLDAKIPSDATTCEVFLWHAESAIPLCVNNLRVISFNEP